jgi:hypothetical protein
VRITPLSPLNAEQARSRVGGEVAALPYPDPAVRWWMMTALESVGEQFFAHIQRRAVAVGKETGVRLDYLSGRSTHDPINTGTVGACS